MLGDVLFVQAIAGEQHGRVLVQRRRTDGTDRGAGRRSNQRMREGIRVGVEHALDTEFLLGRERCLRPEPRERAATPRVGVGAQHRDGARERRRVGRQPLEPVPDEPHKLRGRAAVGDHVDADRARVVRQLGDVQRIAARRRAHLPDDADRLRRAERLLEQPGGSRQRQRRRLETQERPLGREHAVRARRRRRARGDHKRDRLLAHAPRDQPQQAQRQLIRPLRVVEKQRQRPLVGELHNQPPQRVHDLIAARAGARLDPPTRRPAPAHPAARDRRTRYRAPRRPAERAHPRAGR